MDIKSISKMITEAEEKQKGLILRLQGLDVQADNYEQEKTEINLELAAVSVQLSLFRATLPLEDGAEKVMASIPTVEELKDAFQNTKGAAIGKARTFLGKLAESICNLSSADTAGVEVDEATRNSFSAVTSLLKARQRPIARQVIMTLAQDKGVTITEEYVASTLDNLEMLINGGHEQAALYLFKELLEKK